MPEFYTWAVPLTNQSDQIGEKQLSVFGSRGGQNSPLIYVPLLNGRTHGQAQSNMPLQLFQSWGHKNAAKGRVRGRRPMGWGGYSDTFIYT